MEVIAQSTFIRQTPRKLRLVADQIRGLKAQEAEMILQNLEKRGTTPILKTLKQGIANAKNNFNLNLESLRVKKLEIGEGPRMKRYRFAAKGRVHQVLKRMSHIKIILEGEEKEVKKEKHGAKS